MYSKSLQYIERFWKKITFRVPKDSGIRIGLPNPFISPSAERFAYDQFYWDSYFTILGLVVSGRAEFAKGMVENLAYEFDRFGIIPSRNRFYSVGVSQIPFFSSMVCEVFHHTGDKKWLKKMA